jgi:hypothetical protein
MTYPALSVCHCQAEIEKRRVMRKVTNIAVDLRRLTVNLPRTSKNCCENSGGGREESGAKPLNFWLFL